MYSLNLASQRERVNGPQSTAAKQVWEGGRWNPLSKKSQLVSFNHLWKRRNIPFKSYCHQVFPTSKTEIFTSLLRDAEFSWIYNTVISQDPLLHGTVKRQRRSMTYTEALTKISQRKKTNEHWEHKLELQAGELTAEQIGRLSGRKGLLISPCSMQVCSATSRTPLPLTPSTATRPRSQGHRTHSPQWLMCRHPGAHHPPRGCHSTHRLCGSLIVSKHPGRERPDGVYIYI